jgi:hypothetical protein
MARPVAGPMYPSRPEVHPDCLSARKLQGPGSQSSESGRPEGPKDEWCPGEESEQEGEEREGGREGRKGEEGEWCPG